MGITFDPELSDVTNDAYVTGSITATTSQTEAKVGGSTLNGREILYIENKGNVDVFYGPTGVTSTTGARLAKNQFVFLPAGKNIQIFVITASGSASVVVQEFA